MLADVSRPPALGRPAGLPFLGAGRLAAGPMLGGLFGAEGELLARGFLRSRLSTRPLRLRTDGLLDDEGLSASCVGRAARNEGSAWASTKELCSGLEGASLPSGEAAAVTRSLLGGARSPQSAWVPAPLVVTEFELLRPAIACTSHPGLATAVYEVRQHGSAGHQLRIHFADAGCPVMFDGYYHPGYNLEVRRKVFPGVRPPGLSEVQEPKPQGTLGIQLFRLELPDPLRPSRTLRIELPELPDEWWVVHPRRKAEERVDVAAWEAVFL